MKTEAANQPNGSNDRPDFRERVYALAGHSAWREPGTASGTSHLRAIPSDHMIAAALAFGRRNPSDIGPDVAIDMATQRPGNRLKICAALGKAMAGDRSVLIKRNRDYIAHVAQGAYWAVMGRTPTKPEAMDMDDWANLIAAGACILETLAEDALTLVARRNRRAA